MSSLLSESFSLSKEGVPCSAVPDAVASYLVHRGHHATVQCWDADQMASAGEGQHRTTLFPTKLGPAGYKGALQVSGNLLDL